MSHNSQYSISTQSNQNTFVVTS
jgi:regulator of replication initiation timing